MDGPTHTARKLSLKPWIPSTTSPSVTASTSSSHVCVSAESTSPCSAASPGGKSSLKIVRPSSSWQKKASKRGGIPELNGNQSRPPVPETKKGGVFISSSWASRWSAESCRLLPHQKAV